MAASKRDFEVHPELAGVNPPLSEEAFRTLEESILETGEILDSIKFWVHADKKYLLDGRHRIEIGEKHGIEWDEDTLEFDTLNQAKEWVIRYQLGRRNNDRDEEQRLRVELARLGESATDIADEYNVSLRTAQRDKEIAEIIESLPEDILSRYNTGNLNASRSDFKKYAGLSPEQKEAVHQSLRDHPSLTMTGAIPDTRKKIEAEHLLKLSETPAMKGTSAEQKLSLGTITALPKDVDKFCGLDEVKQEVVVELLSEMDDLGEALQTLTSPKEQDKDLVLANTERKFDGCLDRALELLGDLHEISPNQKKFHLCSSKIESLRGGWK